MILGLRTAMYANFQKSLLHSGSHDYNNNNRTAMYTLFMMTDPICAVDYVRPGMYPHCPQIRIFDNLTPFCAKRPTKWPK